MDAINIILVLPLLPLVPIIAIVSKVLDMIPSKTEAYYSIIIVYVNRLGKGYLNHPVGEAGDISKGTTELQPA
jgi:hypothetical protein